MSQNRRAGTPVTFLTPTPERNARLRASFKGPPELQEWVDLSHRLSGIEPLLVPNIQGLGFIDVSLTSFNQTFAASPDGLSDAEKEQFSVDLMIWYTRSQLWVLGAYETVRFVNANVGVLGADRSIRDAWLELKREYERIRVPLVKFRRARTSPRTDLGIAFPAVPGIRGAGWLVAQETVVWRDDLADAMRATLRDLPGRSSD